MLCTNMSNMFNLVQGGQRIIDYSIELQTLAVESEWNSSSLASALYNRLSDVIKDELVTQDPLAGMDTLIATAIHIDRHLQE